MVRLRHRQKQPPTDPIAPDVFPTEQAADHGLHVTDETCTRCGQAILPSDEARRTATGGCAHLYC